MSPFPLGAVTFPMTLPPTPLSPPEISSFTLPFPGPNSVSQPVLASLTAPHPGEAPAPQQVAQVQEVQGTDL